MFYSKLIFMWHAVNKELTVSASMYELFGKISVQPDIQLLSQTFRVTESANNHTLVKVHEQNNLDLNHVMCLAFKANTMISNT